MATKFEKIIEHIINEDEKSARALFHEVVVERSRKIYEEFGVEDEMHDKPEEILDEIDIEENDPTQFEGEGDEDEFSGEGDFEGDEEFGGDEADDLTSDTFVNHDGDNTEDEFDGEEDFGGEDDMNGEGGEEIEDRVVGLEDALDDLKAEFEKYVNGDEEGHEDAADEEDFAADEDDFEADEDEDIADDTEDEVDADEDEEVAENVVREYVEKVTAKAGTTEASGTNTKSPVAGKNDMGGTAKNLNQGSSEEKGRPTPKSEAMSKEKFQNVPGGKAGVKSLKNAPKPDTKSEASGTNKKSPY
jgi:hypothetical protein